MSQTGTSAAVLEQLTRVLASDRFPSEAKLLGLRLLERLRTPVQIVVLGKPQSGKSRLINMLLGHSVYPQIADLPACEIVYGEVRRVFLIQQDQTVHEWHGGPDVPLPDDTLMVRLELPLPILNRFNLTEITLTGPSLRQRDTANWGMERADIVLWCTQGFDAVEQALWSPAPDALKDHSFLVITKADQLLMKGLLRDRIAALEEVVAEEFHSLYSLATIQAIAARTDSDPPEPELWTASGGHALYIAVLRLVDTGRRADTDNALLFLSRYSAAMAQLDPRDRVAPDPDPAIPPDTPEMLGTSQRNREIFVEALDYLQDRADKLLSAIEAPQTNSNAVVLEHCLDTANQLSALLQDFDATDAALGDLQEDVLESADMMLLLQLEQTEDAATDAVTLLLQLKKEMAEKTAG
ncbi:hypothetical protein [Aestuariivita sp.]|jgi:hypothetical protein|uniref:hypothetical protein n=1 Tax=Aestuariivita sp. TaxID=1872407 RepID=UPI0021711BA1|nr:hypothetical protein [Aestuariivita sp.]MCE8008132.1 hypothetical protein [Aestuariivita sp.]